MEGDFCTLRFSELLYILLNVCRLLVNMCIYLAIAKPNTLPLDNKETPSIVLLSFASFSYISL